MPATIRSHARTDVGRVREHNEDNFLVHESPELHLYVVCDGMGGHASGEVASRIAVTALRDALLRDADLFDRFARGDQSVRPEDLKFALESATHAANAEVFAEAARDTSKRGMGTTLTSLVLVREHVFVSHVGDSRCYMIRGGSVQLMTEDHSVINELKRRGKYTPEIMARIGNKNAVTRAVGVYETVEVDTYHFLSASEDRFVLCSDGLHGYLEDNELGPLLQGQGEGHATELLIDLANQRGGKDNITAVVVTISDRQGGLGSTALGYRTLASMPFFRRLEGRELHWVQGIARPRDFLDGETAVTEGAVGDSIFVVLKGHARVLKGDAEIARFEPGDFFGEISLFERTPRTATVVSDGPSQMLEIASADFMKLLHEQSATGVKLLLNFVTELSRRLRTTSQNLMEVREQMHAEDLTDALMSEDESAATPASGLATAPGIAAEAAPGIFPRGPKVPTLRTASELSLAPTLTPPSPPEGATTEAGSASQASTLDARPAEDPVETAPIVRRRRVVSITSEEPSGPFATPITGFGGDDDEGRKTEPPPAGGPPDIIEINPSADGSRTPRR
jgi:serine/threonine protein phosphatase PrpC/CRP-like cAMP-binding protein